MKFVTAIIFALVTLFSVNANAFGVGGGAGVGVAGHSIGRASSTVHATGHGADEAQQLEPARLPTWEESAVIFGVLILPLGVIPLLVLLINAYYLDWRDERALAKASSRAEISKILVFSSSRVKARYHAKHSKG